MVKKGLGDSYDNVIIPRKIRAYGDIMKPASSIGVMLTVPFSAILYGELYHTSGVGFVADNWTTVLYASVTMLLIHGASQALNMAEDAYIDKQTPHKQNRPIPSGVISEEEARSLAWIFMFVGVSRAFTISSQFGIFAVVLAFFGIFYNLDPIRAKKRLWVNLGWQAASRGLLLYPATFAVWGRGLDVYAWSMGVAAFVLVLAYQNTADFVDAEIDAEYGIITPAVHHGLDSLVLIMAGLTVIFYAFITFAQAVDIMPEFWSLYLLAIPMGWSLWSLWNEPTDISNLSGNHFSWFVFYFSLACMYILPATQLTLF